MALATYSDLKTAVANWLNRDDLTSRVPEFISLAHARINRDLEGVRERTTLSISAGVNPVGDTLGRLYSIALDGVGPLQIVTSQQIEEKLNEWGDTAGRPQYAAYTPGIGGGGSLKVAPSPDQTYTANIVYQPVYAAMSADADYNDVLTYHPDIYLFGALAESAPFLKDDERIQMWEAKFAGGLESLRKVMQRRQYPNTPIVRPRRALGE